MAKLPVVVLALAALAALAWGGAARAQAPAAPPAYGMPISLADAKKAAAAAEAEASKLTGPIEAIAIVGPGGELVHFERMDNTQVGSIEVAIDKARSAALFRRPSKVWQDALAAGRTAVLGLRGAVPLDGGYPLVIGGKVVGAIGASGGTGEQDAQIAQAGAAALK